MCDKLWEHEMQSMPDETNAIQILWQINCRIPETKYEQRAYRWTRILCVKSMLIFKSVDKDQILYVKLTKQFQLYFSFKIVKDCPTKYSRLYSKILTKLKIRSRSRGTHKTHFAKISEIINFVFVRVFFFSSSSVFYGSG